MAAAEDELIEALDGVVDALGEACEESGEVADRADAIRLHRRQGVRLSEIPGMHDSGIVVHMSTLLTRLNNATSRLRRAHVRAMREEGATTERIADSLGVTRQRVSALLRDDSERAS